MNKKLTLVLAAVIAITSTGLQKANAQANTGLSNLTSPTAVNQHLIPNNNNGRDLGSAANRWRILYLEGSIYLNDTLFLHSKGIKNTFIGKQAGYSLTTGKYNTAGGYKSLYSITTGNYNTAY